MSRERYNSLCLSHIFRNMVSSDYCHTFYYRVSSSIIRDTLERRPLDIDRLKNGIYFYINGGYEWQEYNPQHKEISVRIKNGVLVVLSG